MGPRATAERTTEKNEWLNRKPLDKFKTTCYNIYIR